MSRLSGKRAIVTGAASGIGRASARAFAREGASVVAVDQAEEGLAETVAMITEAGGTAMAVSANVADEASVVSFINTCVETYGGLDVIYANAGVSGGRVPLAEQTVEHWLGILQINLIGPFLCIKHGAPIMAGQGKGSIICTASVAALRANAGGMPYAASKAGVVSLVQTAAHEMFGSGVRFNAICPGLIETGMTKPTFDRARSRGTDGKIGQLNPTRRNGEPEEIANMALFLASDEASYVNGQSYAVDGGLTSSHPFVPKG
ncbi:MAG: SDR family oxidoreductase [Rhodospirillaceae bacterium]|jgi:NAD(P)-dependent dehydrogenase (short-subunit alcohol dehydrogenase family)|nr:SDR family oxidoreductase [Rhodospirillaceae bacterium]MBT4688341.1 SDR family oxidoreductase [Rhodospirillaceae bacterium]MBT5080053.1 SDR family oxidoreductase [Rhodospirillaceae bacterium]MBT5525642.1 SDR family oxidoreductase [Rhodospirillaceae bacterium]MBT5880401.1 SDR family oxidoreductase [Rhodospirillaceae bacterium]